jgi:hypothetical protein
MINKDDGSGPGRFVLEQHIKHVFAAKRLIAVTTSSHCLSCGSNSRTSTPLASLVEKMSTSSSMTSAALRSLATPPAHRRACRGRGTPC